MEQANTAAKLGMSEFSAGKDGVDAMSPMTCGGRRKGLVVTSYINKVKRGGHMLELLSIVGVVKICVEVSE